MRCISWLVLILSVFTIQACKHPLAIKGEGDIVEVNGSGRGCTLEQFRAGDPSCTENEVTSDYSVNYKAVPRPGWRFVRWEGPCAPKSEFQHCSLNIPADGVDWWDENYADQDIPPSTAVFQRVTGETGFLVDGLPVAGVTYETSTQQGVTGLDGSFQYELDETIRFSIGATVLGEIKGKEQVTPFDLAVSAIHTGINILWALQDEEDPYHNAINIAVLLESLDYDGNPDNGVEISQGVAALLKGLQLNLIQRWNLLQADPTMRHLLGRANRKRLFSVMHGIVKPAGALDRMYRGLGIDPGTLGLEQVQVQGNDSGSSMMTEENFQYDFAGYLTRHDVTLFGGAFEFWKYDGNGNPTRYEQLADKHGVHSVETWHYDENGNVVRFEDDHTGIWDDMSRVDGMPERIGSYLYDGDNNQTDAAFVIFNREDGTTNQYVEHFRYKYDVSGNLINYIETPHSRFLVQRWWYYDEQGNIRRFEDSRRGTWYYDQEGKVTRYISVSEDRWYRYFYDTNGNLILKEQIDRVDNAVDQVETWQYDNKGNVILYNCNSNCEGVHGSLADERIDSWQYHNNNQVSLHEIETTYYYKDLDTLEIIDVVEERWRYYFDLKGNLISFEADGDDDVVDFVQHWQYDSSSNLIQAETDSDANGHADSTEYWNYDEDGKLIRFLHKNAEGTIETDAKYYYTPTGWGHLVSEIEVYGYDTLPPLKPMAEPGN